MNLRKDHYRSFTRTLCTVVVSSGLGRPLVGRPSLAHPASAASRFESCAFALRLVAPPARVQCLCAVLRAPKQEIIQLLSMDILA